MLGIALGTDILPAISLSHEEGELDIMLRKPRSKDVRLVNFKIMLLSYLWFGWVQAFGCFVSYFVVLNDFGFTLSGLFYLNNLKGIIPGAGDFYDPNAANLGNSNLK